MFKMFLKYYGDLLFYNLIVSIGLIGYIYFQSPIPVYIKAGIKGFKANPDFIKFALFNGTISFLLIGFIFSIFIFGKLHEKEYYFYYNVGFSKNRLLINTLLLNITIFFSLLIIIYQTGAI
jgi:hypothetical protein